MNTLHGRRLSPAFLIRLTLCLSLCLLSLCGCARVEGKELGERLIIEAIGIDKAPQGVKITLQTLDIHALGGSGGAEEPPQVTGVYSFTGPTVGQALSEAAGVTGLTPLYSQARLILLGKPLAKEGVSGALDFFLREYNARSDILIAVAENNAADIVGADLGDSVADAKVLEDAIDAGSENGKNVSIPLYRFMNLMLSPTDTAYCPILTVTASEEDMGDSGAADTGEEGKDKKEIKLLGTAFFKDASLAYTVDETLTQGLKYLTGDVKKAVFTVDGEDGKFTLSVINARTKIKTKRDAGGGFLFHIRIRLTCDITQYETPDFRDLAAEDARLAQTLARDYISSLAKKALSTLFYEKNADICRFARRVKLKYPHAFDLYKNTIYSDDYTKIYLQTEVTVRRTGKESL